MKPVRCAVGVILVWLAFAASPGVAADWAEELDQRITAIDGATPGAMGVYVKDLRDGTTLNHDADRAWYLASTIKVPVAITVLQQVEAGKLSLDDQLVLQESDFVDGAGQLLWTDPGARYTVRDLLGHSLTQSDSTATDMLIRLVGEDDLQRHIKDMVGDGFGPITTIIQVRYDAYSEVHQRARDLSNMDYVRLRSVPAERRFQALLDQLGLSAEDIQSDSIDEAFARYYQHGLNTASMEAFGLMLERLVRGELLNPEHTELILDLMQQITTGDDRIKAGLPANTPFAQKTGTQLDRACNVGIIQPEAQGDQHPIIIAACLEEFGETATAERALEKLGAALSETKLLH